MAWHSLAVISDGVVPLFLSGELGWTLRSAVTWAGGGGGQFRRFGAYGCSGRLAAAIWAYEDVRGGETFRGTCFLRS